MVDELTTVSFPVGIRFGAVNFAAEVVFGASGSERTCRKVCLRGVPVVPLVGGGHTHLHGKGLGRVVTGRGNMPYPGLVDGQVGFGYRGDVVMAFRGEVVYGDGMVHLSVGCLFLDIQVGNLSGGGVVPSDISSDGHGGGRIPGGDTSCDATVQPPAEAAGVGGCPDRGFGYGSGSGRETDAGELLHLGVAEGGVDVKRAEVEPAQV